MNVLDRENIGDLHDVEQRGDARRDILAVGGGGREEGVVPAHKVDDQRRDIFRERMGIGGVVGEIDRCDARDPRCGLGHSGAARSSNDEIDLANLQRGGDGGECRILDGGVVMFDPDKSFRHQATPSSLSLATRVSTSGTLMPAWRIGGSDTLRMARRGVVSTP